MNLLQHAVSGCSPGIALAILLFASAAPQNPAGPPSGATGICKDGTYSMAAAKDGACRGHKGVQTWYSVPLKVAPTTPVAPSSVAEHAPAPVPTTPAEPAPPPAPHAKSGIAAERARLASQPPAPGGGPGLVWLNSSSMVYHCPGSDFYGKTKTGSYLSESDAKAKGAHPNHNKPCA